jgi:hypothetical protein
MFFSYLESHGEGAVVRPWVWIAYLFLGPAVRTIAFQCYIFIAVSNRASHGGYYASHATASLLLRQVPLCALQLSSPSSSLSTLCAFA